MSYLCRGSQPRLLQRKQRARDGKLCRSHDGLQRWNRTLHRCCSSQMRRYVLLLTTEQTSSLRGLDQVHAKSSRCVYSMLARPQGPQACLQVALAQQVYDYVDQRIRRLDKDIKVFDGVIAKQRSLLGLPVRLRRCCNLCCISCCAVTAQHLPRFQCHRAESYSTFLTVSIVQPQGSLPASEAAAELAAGSELQGPAAAKPTANAVPAAVVGQQEEDPSEPVYCYCQQVRHVLAPPVIFKDRQACLDSMVKLS